MDISSNGARALDHCGKFIGKISRAELLVLNEVFTAPRACIDQSENLDSWKLSMYFYKEIVVIVANNNIGHEHVVFCSTVNVIDLVQYCKSEVIPTLVLCNANVPKTL